VPMKILIATDAWHPQINGVVTTLDNLKRELVSRGHEVTILNQDNCNSARSFSLPGYPEIQLAFPSRETVAVLVEGWADAVHIATPEGTIGRSVLKYCDKRDIPYTTGYHTKWPEFLKAKFSWIPRRLVYAYMRNLHKNSKAVLVPTETAYSELKLKHFTNVKVWTRGVDRTLFNADHRCALHCGRPLLLCVSRVSREKNLDEFCEIAWPGRHTKMLVGDGPYLPELKKRYSDTVIFTGMLTGHELAHAYACADVFVFPSLSDTFGVVMIESMATGTPVAAHPVTGPIDVVEPGATGYLDQDLMVAVKKCLELDREQVVKHSQRWTWTQCADQFLDYVTAKS
jgi:glycosyltransferase involved in cell wall biosynthesis